MKVVAFNGSARKDGNTAILINEMFEELKKEGIETEMVQLAGKPLRGCRACRGCFHAQNQRCVVTDDGINEYIAKMIAADGIILGSPTYFADITAEMKALIDRAGYVAKANGDALRRKVGAAVVTARRAGAVHAYDSINHFFLINQMIVPGSRYWNIGTGREIGEVREDEEGMDTMRVLGRNMAWLIKKINA